MRLLLADRDELFLEILQRYFHRYGYVTEVATNRPGYLAALRDFQPDLLVWDDALNSVVEGGETVQINAEPMLFSIPVVLIGDRLADFHLHVESPFVAYFRKPFKLGDLLAAVTSATSRSQRAELPLLEAV